MKKILENRGYVFETGIKFQTLELEVSCVSWTFASGGQSGGVSASASVLPMNTQD